MNKDGYHSHLYDGYEELLEFLLTKIDVNITDNDGATPLHYCCQYMHFPSENLLKLLFKQSNINVNATMTYTRKSFDNSETPLGLVTPLHLCCDIVAENSSRIALLLLQRDDINVHAVNEAGQTPRDVAKAGKKVWVIELHHGPMSGVSGPSGMTNFDLLFLLEEDELIKNFNNLANVFE